MNLLQISRNQILPISSKILPSGLKSVLEVYSKTSMVYEVMTNFVVLEK